jgi:hypothetical protein
MGMKFGCASMLYLDNDEMSGFFRYENQLQQMYDNLWLTESGCCCPF